MTEVQKEVAMSDFKSLIEALCALPSETEYVEFKESYSDFNKEVETSAHSQILPH